MFLSDGSRDAAHFENPAILLRNGSEVLLDGAENFHDEIPPFQSANTRVIFVLLRDGACRVPFEVMVL